MELIKLFTIYGNSSEEPLNPIAAYRKSKFYALYVIPVAYTETLFCEIFLWLTSYLIIKPSCIIQISQY